MLAMCSGVVNNRSELSTIDDDLNRPSGQEGGEDRLVDLVASLGDGSAKVGSTVVGVLFGTKFNWEELQDIFGGISVGRDIQELRCAALLWL